MLEINLLPWRDALRKQKKKNQYIILFLSFIISLVVGMLVKLFSPSNAVEKINITNKLNATPNVKYIGFLQQGENKMALIVSSQGEISDVKQGAFIEKNNEKVLAINSAEMVIQMPNHSLQKIKLQSQEMV